MDVMKMSNDLITVAAIQALPIGHLLNPENVPHALELLKQAAEQKADIACFPEAYPATGEEEICRAASELEIFVIAGLLPKEGNELYNESLLINSQGQVLGRHRKSVSVPGVEPYCSGKEDYSIYETPWGKTGILICMEGWGFPEGFYRLNKAGVDLVFNPNLIFKKKPQRRMSLLSRVLDYKIPIIAPNNAVWSLRIFPEDQGMPAEGGESLILAPPIFHAEDDIVAFMKEAPSCEGWIVAEGRRDEEILTAKIDLQGARQTRSLWNDCFLGID